MASRRGERAAEGTPLYVHQEDDMDFNCGTIVDGTETIDEVGRRVFDHVCRVASGEVQAKAEETRHREFGIWAEQSVSL